MLDEFTKKGPKAQFLQILSQFNTFLHSSAAQSFSDV